MALPSTCTWIDRNGGWDPAASVRRCAHDFVRPHSGAGGGTVGQRRATVRRADQFIVLKNWRSEAAGSPEGLLASSEVMRRLWDRSAARRPG